MAGTAQRRVLFTELGDQQRAHELIEAAGGHVDRLVAPAQGKSIELAPELVRLLQQVMQVVARGGTVVVSSPPDELTTTVAADRLGISRPTLMKMIESGEVRAHKVGSHHRLKTADVDTLRRERLVRQREAFDELRRLEDEIDRF